MNTIDWSKPIETVHGLKARLVSDQIAGRGSDRLVLLTTTPGREVAEFYRATGDHPMFNSFKLRNKAAKKVLYRRIFKNGDMSHLIAYRDVGRGASEPYLGYLKYLFVGSDAVAAEFVTD